MRHLAKISLTLALLLLSAGCGDSRLARTDGGGVLLSVQDFDGLPNVVDVSAIRGPGFAVIEQVTIQSIVRDIDGDTSDLMTVEMQSYEVTYTRADGGTRVPPPLVEKVFGSVGPGATIVYDNLPFLRSAQLNTPPLSDLFIENGGFDKEIDETSILLNVNLRFFGRSLSGEAVDTAPVRFTVEFVP